MNTYRATFDGRKKHMAKVDSFERWSISVDAESQDYAFMKVHDYFEVRGAIQFERIGIIVGSEHVQSEPLIG